MGSDTSVGEEMEMLRRRNKELEELVSAREARLVAVANEMAELQGEVEEGKADRIVTAELRRRVALLEEEVANGVRRSEGQAKELEKMRKAVAAEAGEDQEREEMIADLRSEGEALARQNGKQAEVIRKLRAKEKTADKDIDKFKSESEKAKSELERLSKSLAEKNSLEGTQSEAIKNLTEANQAWELENKKIKNDLEDNVEKVSGLRKSLEAAYRFPVDRDVLKQLFAPSGVLHIMMHHCRSGSSHFLFSLSPTPQCHNSCSKSQQHDQCNAGQLMQ